MSVVPGNVPDGTLTLTLIRLLPPAEIAPLFVTTVPFVSVNTTFHPEGRPVEKFDVVLALRSKLSAAAAVLLTKRTNWACAPAVTVTLNIADASGPRPAPSAALAPPASERVLVRSALLAITVVRTSLAFALTVTFTKEVATTLAV